MGFNPNVGGNLNLSSLTSIPEGFNPNVGGSLDLSSLTSIPEGFNPTNIKGKIYIQGKEWKPEVVKKPNRKMEEIKSFCKKHKITENQFYGKDKFGGYLDLYSLTSIPGRFQSKCWWKS